jgi:hypothetical protein
VKAGTLGAHVVATAATSTITLTAVWEVSDDATTWDRVLDAAASVLFATGTVSAVTGQVSAPNAVNSKRYARCSCLVGVTTGGASDHFVVRYDYILDPGA